MDLADRINKLDSELFAAQRQSVQLTEQLGQAVIDKEKAEAKFSALQSAYRELLDSVTFNSDHIYMGEDDVH